MTWVQNVEGIEKNIQNFVLLSSWKQAHVLIHVAISKAKE